MINSIEEYLRQLKKEMSGCDRATIQDALSDSEEYLRNALESKQRMRQHGFIAQGQELLRNSSSHSLSHSRGRYQHRYFRHTDLT